MTQRKRLANAPRLRHRNRRRVVDPWRSMAGAVIGA